MQIDDLEHEKIRMKMEGLKASMEASFYMMNLTLEDIKKDSAERLTRIENQTTKTNGRVTLLESDYVIIRVLRTNKFLLLFIIFGILKIYELIDLNWLISKLISFF